MNPFIQESLVFLRFLPAIRFFPVTWEDANTHLSTEGLCRQKSKPRWGGVFRIWCIITIEIWLFNGGCMSKVWSSLQLICGDSMLNQQRTCVESAAVPVLCLHQSLHAVSMPNRCRMSWRSHDVNDAGRHENAVQPLRFCNVTDAGVPASSAGSMAFCQCRQWWFYGGKCWRCWLGYN